MNRAEKEVYLREYELLKKEGKPFFPYAVMKDSTMALIVVGMIVLLAIVLGAEQGPKADPTTTTYTPRPEWYFFFLFEVLRVIKPYQLVPLATIGVPTIGMVVLLLLPFIDRGPERRPERRPIAMTVLVLTVASMAYLTIAGAVAGPPSNIDLDVAPQYEAGKEVVAQSGCLACHKIGDNGNGTLGPDLTHIGSRIPRNAILRSLQAGPGIMPSFTSCAPGSNVACLSQKKLNQVADFLASLK
jgi:quinol---cytochrome c reductase cytochrome c subunit, bacillus type